MASLAEQLVRQLGVRPEQLQLDPRKWAPTFRSATAIQRTQGESRSSEGSGTSSSSSGGSGGGGSGGNAGTGSTSGTGMRDRDSSQASGSRQESQTSAKQAATRHGRTCASLCIFQKLAHSGLGSFVSSAAAFLRPCVNQHVTRLEPASVNALILHAALRVCQEPAMGCLVAARVLNPKPELSECK